MFIHCILLYGNACCSNAATHNQQCAASIPLVLTHEPVFSSTTHRVNDPVLLDSSRVQSSFRTPFGNASKFFHQLETLGKQLLLNIAK
uniref:Secreted protein n=1 Tax=Arundo donax TaxID=35708 RepID=A0A0A9AKY9_ARUDO